MDRRWIIALPVVLLSLLSVHHALASAAQPWPAAERVPSRQDASCPGPPLAPDETAVIGTVLGEVDATVDGTQLTEAPLPEGDVRIPELGLSTTITQGCFAFRDLVLPQDPMLVSIEIESPGYRPATWANYLVLSAGAQVTFNGMLHLGTEPELTDPCPSLLATPAEQLSAAQQQHATLCAALQDAASASLPITGSGGDTGGASTPLLPLALAGAGLVVVAGGTLVFSVRRAVGR